MIKFLLKGALLTAAAGLALHAAKLAEENSREKSSADQPAANDDKMTAEAEPVQEKTDEIPDESAKTEEKE